MTEFHNKLKARGRLVSKASVMPSESQRGHQPGSPGPGTDHTKVFQGGLEPVLVSSRKSWRGLRDASWGLGRPGHLLVPCLHT